MGIVNKEDRVNKMLINKNTGLWKVNYY